MLFHKIMSLNNLMLFTSKVVLHLAQSKQCQLKLHFKANTQMVLKEMNKVKKTYFSVSESAHEHVGGKNT